MPKVTVMKKRGQVVNDLDRAFRRIKKLEWSNNSETGYIRCFTCNESFPVNEIEIGHFHKRKYLAIRWHDDNVRPQCHRCNQAMEGTEGSEKARILYDIYKRRLQIEIGADSFNQLEAQKLDKPATYELEEMLKLMKSRG